MRETSCDTLLGGRLRLTQLAGRGYRTGIDPVLLASALPTPKRKKNKPTTLLDLGAGVGTVSLCALHHHHYDYIYAVEIFDILCDLCRLNFEDNHFGGRLNIINADLTNSESQALIPHQYFDQVTLNPPFFDRDTQDIAVDPLKAGGRHAQPDSLILWINLALNAVNHGGYIHMILASEQLPLALKALENRQCAITIKPIHTFEGLPAKRVIIQARKRGKGKQFTLLPPLFLHDEAAKLPNDHPQRRRYTKFVTKLLDGEERIPLHT